MYKDIVTCNTCKHFYINPDGVSMCDNQQGLPFPSANDYCSQGVASDATRVIDNGELLRKVYEQRRSS